MDNKQNNKNNRTKRYTLYFILIVLFTYFLYFLAFTPNNTNTNMSDNSGKYIVVFNDDIGTKGLDRISQQIKDQGGSVTHRYDSLFLGLAITLGDRHLATLLAHPSLKSIEPDGQVSIFAQNQLKGSQ